MKSKAEWYPYRVGSLPSGNWTNDDCVPFDSVHYNCHVGDAFRVFADGRIQSSLVWDESKLRNTRTFISWVSANTWANGSIYGNIRFEFDWKKLIAGRHFYWVEIMTGYKPPAFRILVSEDSQSGLSKYDTESGDGPLLYYPKTDKWYRNGKLTSEFMIDSDLSLDECTSVVFDDHNPTYCRKHKAQCAYLGKSGVEAGAELIARLVAHGRRRFLKLLYDRNSRSQCLHRSAAGAYSHLRKLFKVGERASGTIRHDDPASPALVSAILDNYGFYHRKEAAPLRDLFKSTEQLRIALSERMRWAFRLPSENALRGEEED